MLGSRKDGAVNSTGKGEQESLQRPGSTGTGPQRIRNISPQQKEETKFQVEEKKYHTKRYTHTHTQKNSMSFT